MEFNDWELSAEEMDILEKEALQTRKRKRAQQHNSSSSYQTQQTHQYGSVLSDNNSPIPDSPAANPLPPASLLLPTSSTSRFSFDDNSSGLPKLSVKFFLHVDGNIAAKFVYNQALVGACRKIPKASWNAEKRLWIFPVSAISSAKKILSEVSGFTVEVEDLDPLVQRAISAAFAVQDLRERYESIPSSIESKLLPFQRDGVRFALQHGVRVLLADEMGLGKTLQALAVAACIHDCSPVLILTPSSLLLHWASMIQQWLNIPSSDILVVLSNWGGSNRGGFRIVSSSSKGTVHFDGLFNIISYDLVPKLENTLMASQFKLVIADESHYLKNAQAKRTTASIPVIKRAQYAMLLSGTPALSRPIELFKQLEALYPSIYKNVHEYGKRYCKGGSFGVYQGASNHEELHNLMKATVMIRRLKKDVLSQLPVKRRQQVFLDLAAKDLKQINALFRELEDLKSKIKACDSQEKAESLKFSQKNLVNKIYTDSAEAKIPAVLNYLETVIESGCKFLVFAHHQPMIDSIYQFLLVRAQNLDWNIINLAPFLPKLPIFQKKKVGCIRIDGSTPPASRQDLVTDFQEKDAIKAAVLSIKAGGVGLTLTAASTVIFVELSWTPGDLIQAEDRAHRIGQVSSVNIYYLLANDTVDDIIWDVVQSKLENLGQMLDGHENTLEVSVSQPRSSPVKQKTLDHYLKRCNTEDEHQPNPKFPRH